MRLANTEHTSRPWRIHDLVDGFRLEDVWALPVTGGPGDFPDVIELFTAFDPDRIAAPAARALFAVRKALGGVLGWDSPEAGVESEARPSLRDRLPADLRDGPSGPAFAAVAFESVYMTESEWAAELANRTVHGVLHLGWVPLGAGCHQAHMAVYVKPNGVLGHVYMAAIRPFRYVLVYPQLLRQLGRRWQAKHPVPAGAEPGA